MKFSGKTEDASSPILGAKFWTKGEQLSGTIIGSFETKNGVCHEIKLDRPLKVSGRLISPEEEGEVTLPVVAMGAMKGWEMAVRAALKKADVRTLLTNDKVVILCTGATNTGQASDRVNFAVDVERN